MCRHRVTAIEGHPCGQFSYPTIQVVPDDASVLVAYTVLFLPASMPPDCKVCCPGPIDLNGPSQNSMMLPCG